MQEIGQNVDLQWDGLHQWIQQKHEVLKIEFWLSHNKELSALWISFVLVHEQVTDAQIKAILESVGIYDFESENLEIDSLQLISILVSVEEEFNVSIDEMVILDTKLQSINDFVSLLKSVGVENLD